MNTLTSTLEFCLATFQGNKKGILIIFLGFLVACNFALAKFVVLNGIPAFSVFYYQLVGASILLLSFIAMQGQKLSFHSHHIRYYVIGGVLSVSAPQIVAYAVLKHIPNGLFAVLVTLSPLMTFVLTSLFERQLLPLYRLIGILIGLGGVSIVTMTGFNTETTSVTWILLAFSVPILLGITNVYRSKAFPEDAHPLSLATGTLLSQTLMLLPVLLITRQTYLPWTFADMTDFAIIALACITALSYILTFVLQRLTDGVGFSQVGYFVTLSGVFIGAVAFDEPLGFSLIGSVALLFLGLTITNGQLSFIKKFRRFRAKKIENAESVY